MLPNPRHERFAQALAAGKTADEAYQEAGYAENRGNATRLKANESVRARVAELQGRITEGVVLTRQWVLERLIENANRAMQAEAATAKDGKPTGIYSYEGSVANRALELLGKELGMFVDRSSVDQVVSVAEPVDRPPDETREQWIARRKQEVASLGAPSGPTNGRYHS